MSETNRSRSYLAGVIGNKTARITVLVVALIFAGGFWLLESAGAIEAGPTAGIIGVVLFVIVTFPAAMIAGRTADQALEHDER